MKFQKPPLMTWSGNKISDHNRGPLDISPERIENRKRMANATSRAYIIADKKSFSASWTELPSTSANTVDNFWGAKEMENFYKTGGVFTLLLTEGNGQTSSHLVYFSSFSCTINKRTGKYDRWDVSVELVEV